MRQRSNGGAPLRERPVTREEQLEELWAMSPAERVRAMRDGRLSLFQLARWSSRHPEQVPLLEGEFEWLTIKTPEWAEARPRPSSHLPVSSRGERRGPRRGR